VPLIGFSGSPWTLATYMIEGGSTKDFRQIKTMMYQQPELLHKLMATITDSVIAYLNAQIAAGVQTVMVFDTWGGVLTTRDYEGFSLQYMQKIVQGLNTGSGDDRTPVILFTKGGGLWLEQIADTGCDAVGLDWSIEIGDARARVGDKVALQGNMDPAMLRAPDERIRQEVKHIIESYGEGSGHVFNLGHGITPDIDPDKVEVYVNAVHEFSKS
jgi:uroporphyrinogen decarboxylase